MAFATVLSEDRHAGSLFKKTSTTMFAITRSGRRKILIVEDDELIGWSMAYALGRAGFDPEVVDCAEAALGKIAAGGYGVVISDFTLPRMDGLRFTAGLRTISPSLPVILMSAREEICLPEAESNAKIDFFIE